MTAGPKKIGRAYCHLTLVTGSSSGVINGVAVVDVLNEPLHACKVTFYVDRTIFQALYRRRWNFRM